MLFSGNERQPAAAVAAGVRGTLKREGTIVSSAWIGALGIRILENANVRDTVDVRRRDVMKQDEETGAGVGCKWSFAKREVQSGDGAVRM